MDNKDHTVIFRLGGPLKARLDKLAASEGYTTHSEFIRHAVRKEIERIEKEKGKHET